MKLQDKFDKLFSEKLSQKFVLHLVHAFYPEHKIKTNPDVKSTDFDCVTKEKLTSAVTGTNTRCFMNAETSVAFKQWVDNNLENSLIKRALKNDKR